MYSIDVTVVWKGQYRVDDGPMLHLGELRTGSSHPYTVVEVRSRLIR